MCSVFWMSTARRRSSSGLELPVRLSPPSVPMRSPAPNVRDSDANAPRRVRP